VKSAVGSDLRGGIDSGRITGYPELMLPVLEQIHIVPNSDNPDVGSSSALGCR